MDYSLSIKNLFSEISRLKSYSRLHPVLRVIMVILMLPFIVAAASAIITYRVICFFRSAWQIISDELESWLKEQEKDKHWGPTAVLYFVTLPFIFLLRSVMAVVFSGALYVTWFAIMVFSYPATLGGIRWQPQLNKVDYDKEYTWEFKYTNAALNGFVFVNIGLVALCVLQAAISEYGMVEGWLSAITAFVIYIAYPRMFAKVNLCELSGADAIYEEAYSYESVLCVANITRARKIMERIPEHNDAKERINDYTDYINQKKKTSSTIGRILMIVLGAIIVAAVILPPIVGAIEEWADNSNLVYYYKNDSSGFTVSCNNTSVKSITIDSEVQGMDVLEITAKAFYNCNKLEEVTIPNTIQKIGSEAFANCSSLRTIYFEGTMSEWYMIEKGEDWNENTGYYSIKCIDGYASRYDDLYW